jgi:hypothetical protein
MPLPPSLPRVPKKAPPSTIELGIEDLKPHRSSSNKGLWITSVLLLVLAGGAGALYWFHLPPFSPPPKPIAEEKPAERAPAPPAPAEAAKPEEKPAAQAKPEEKPPEPAKPVEAKPAEKPAPEPEAEKAPKHPNLEKAEKQVQKGRQLLVEGHEHTALEYFKRAEKLAPAGKLASAIKVYEQQALGKLGRAELVIEGKFPVTVDGHKFTPPRKVKVAAGPHMVDPGDGETEVVLKRGEKKKLKGHR